MKFNKKVRLALRTMLLKTSRVSTDKGELIFDEEELAVGVEVFVEQTNGEDTELVPAEDGEYAQEDRIIVVSEGKVSEIRDKVSEEPEQTEVEVPVEEPVDEPEVIEERSLEDRVEALENSLAEALEGLNEILSAMSEINGRIDELKERINKLEGEPAEPPIDDQEVIVETHNSRMSYLKRN